MGMWDWFTGGKEEATTQGTTTSQATSQRVDESTQQAQAQKQKEITRQKLLSNEALAGLEALFAKQAGASESMAGVDLTSLTREAVDRPAVDVSALMDNARLQSERKLTQERARLSEGTGSSFNTAIGQALGESAYRGESELAATQAQLEQSVGQGIAQRLATVAGAKQAETSSAANIASILKGATSETDREYDTQSFNDLARVLLQQDDTTSQVDSSGRAITGGSAGGLLKNLTLLAGLDT